MGKIISVTNQKGGVGKTTTAVNLAAGLVLAGRRVLLIDLDPQGNATSGCGFPRGKLTVGTYEVLTGQVGPDEPVTAAEPEGLFLLPATMNLAGAEIELADVERREFVLKERIAPLRAAYDFVLLDCPPSLGLITLNALVAADTVLVPVQAEYYALEGVAHLTRTIEAVKKRLNPALEVEGFVLTMFVKSQNLSMQVADQVRRRFGRKVFDAVIPRTVRIAEAPSHGRPVCMYDAASQGSKSYLELAHELLVRNGAAFNA